MIPALAAGRGSSRPERTAAAGRIACRDREGSTTDERDRPAPRSDTAVAPAARRERTVHCP